MPINYPFLFSLFAAGSLVQRAMEILRNDRGVLGRKPHSLALWLIVVHLGFTLGSVAECWLGDEALGWGASLAGGGLFLISFFIRRAVLRTLGEFWAIDVDIKPNHRLLTLGPFAYCRHPNYLAMLLELIGTCLLGRALLTLALTLPAYGVLLALRVRVEERALIAKFGEEYLDYRRTTPAIVPRIFGRRVGPAA